MLGCSQVPHWGAAGGKSAVVLSPAPDKPPEKHCPGLAALGMLWGHQIFRADIPVVLLQRCCLGPAASTQLSLLTNLWKSGFPSYFLLPSPTQTGLTLAVEAKLAGGPGQAGL